jgi:hypothetical protein
VTARAGLRGGGRQAGVEIQGLPERHLLQGEGVIFRERNEIRPPIFRFHSPETSGRFLSDLNPTGLPDNCRTAASAGTADADGNRAQQPLLEFAAALPPKIQEFDGAPFFKVLDLVNALRAKDANAVPFALTITAGRLSKHWQLIHVATRPAGSRAVAKIVAMPYAIAVSMVLDRIDEKRLSLLDALKTNRILLAKEALNEIYEIEDGLRERIDLGKSDWGNRLHHLTTSIDAALDAEINAMPRRPPQSQAHLGIRQAAPGPFLVGTLEPDHQEGPSRTGWKLTQHEEKPCGKRPRVTPPPLDTSIAHRSASGPQAD